MGGQPKSIFQTPLNNVILTKSVNAQMSNRPVYSCGSKELAGYVSIHLYDSVSAMGIGQDMPSGNPLYHGSALLTGYATVFDEVVIAKDV